jgi:GNAT superfamily N-acetyltransferase
MNRSHEDQDLLSAAFWCWYALARNHRRIENDRHIERAIGIVGTAHTPMIMTNIRVIFLCASISMYSHAISALIISPPASFGDYRQLASLLVGTFDVPSLDSATNSTSLQFNIDALRWNMFEKSLTEEHTLKKYTNTARRMRGKKYCLLIAKEYIKDDDGNQQMRVGDDVIGMVEMGMSLCPTCSNYNRTDNTVLRPQPTVGVLCVKASHRKKGIGQALIQKCEQVAENVWNEELLFVDVEPSNHNTMTLFEKWGYTCIVNETGEAQMRNTTVSRRRIERFRPHYLLRKRLDRTIV